MGTGQLFLSKARDEDADLLVMRGYGHAPWREALFGGATRELVGTSLLTALDLDTKAVPGRFESGFPGVTNRQSLGAIRFAEERHAQGLFIGFARACDRSG